MVRLPLAQLTDPKHIKLPLFSQLDESNDGKVKFWDPTKIQETRWISKTRSGINSIVMFELKEICDNIMLINSGEKLIIIPLVEDYAVVYQQV